MGHDFARPRSGRRALMLRSYSLCLATAMLAVLLIGTVVAKEIAKELSKSEAEAAALVDRAITAQINGRSEERAALLAQALEIAPDYAPARWHSGQVLHNGRWTKAADLALRAASDEKLAEYRRLRLMHGGNAVGELQLARWCRKQGYDEEARLHWIGVLLHDPTNFEAIRALGLQKYRGRWLPP